jgi:hypothetical protein
MVLRGAEQSARDRIKQKNKADSEAKKSAVLKSMFDSGLDSHVKTFLLKYELGFFIKKVSLSQASKELKSWSSFTRHKIADLNIMLNWGAKQHCKFWRAKLKPAMRTVDATEDYWDRLKNAVAKLEEVLSCEEVKSDETAARIVRTKIATNTMLLKGLPERLKFWKR